MPGIKMQIETLDSLFVRSIQVKLFEAILHPLVPKIFSENKAIIHNSACKLWIYSSLCHHASGVKDNINEFQCISGWIKGEQ